MGGVAGAILAAMHPGLIGRLVLEDPAWYPREEDITAEEILEHVQEWSAAILQRQTLPASELLENLRREHPDWDAEEFPAIVQAKQQVSPHVTQYDLATDDTPWWEIVPVLQCPVLLLTGDEEGQVAIAPAMEQEIGTLNPHIQIARIPGAGHNVRRDQFSTYLQLLTAFLQPS